MSLPPPPKRVYRFFEKEEYAKMFVEGKICLSTFDYIRQCDRTRGDPEEATATYRSGLALWGPDGVPMNQAARNLEAIGWFKGGNVRNAVVYNSQINYKLYDAWMLCTTLDKRDSRLRSTFGKYCVEIRDPLDFFNVMTDIMEADRMTGLSAFKPLKYVGRDFSAEEQAMEDVAFIGPAKNAWEKEARMMWRPAPGSVISPMVVDAPEVKGFCRAV